MDIKLETELPHDPDKTINQKDTGTPMFRAALFTVAKTWQQPECSWTEKWIVYGHVLGKVGFGPFC